MKNKQRSAYRRGEKLAVFFKRGIIVLSVVIFVVLIVLGVEVLMRAFFIKNVIVSGNYHLGKKDIISSANIKAGESLLKLSSKDTAKRLKRSAWIREVFLRKQFPDTLSIRIEEAVPKALHSFNGRIFLIDEDGNILEEIKSENTPFLPVIKNINPKKDKEALLEALKLIEVLDEKGILDSRESIEIGNESYGLVVNIDGELIKVGYGKYSEKFYRWKELEHEIRKRALTVEYVDLRFDDVIVKPLKRAKVKNQKSKLQDNFPSKLSKKKI